MNHTFFIAINFCVINQFSNLSEKPRANIYCMLKPINNYKVESTKLRLNKNDFELIKLRPLNYLNITDK